MSNFRTDAVGIVDGLRRKSLNGAWVKSLEDRVEELDGILGRFQSAVESAESGGRLTPVGIQELRGVAAEKARAELENVRQAKATVTDQIQRIQNNMSLPTPAESDPTLRYLRAREIRDHLRQLDPLKVRSLYENAILQNDVELIAAIEGAPKVAPLIDPQVVEDRRDTLLATNNPEAAQKRDELRLFSDTLGYFIGKVENEIDGAGS